MDRNSKEFLRVLVTGWTFDEVIAWLKVSSNFEQVLKELAYTELLAIFDDCANIDDLHRNANMEYLFNPLKDPQC